MLRQYCKSVQYIWLPEIFLTSPETGYHFLQWASRRLSLKCGLRFFPHSHTLPNNPLFPCSAVTCQMIWSIPHFDINHSTFSFSVARFFVANSCSCCHNSVLPFFAATCHTVRSESSLTNKVLLLMFSGVSTSLAHSHSMSSTAICPCMLPRASSPSPNICLNVSCYLTALLLSGL